MTKLRLPDGLWAIIEPLFPQRDRGRRGTRQAPRRRSWAVRPVWGSERLEDRVLLSSAVVNEFTATPSPRAIVGGPGGDLWFTDPSTRSLTSINASTGAVGTSFPLTDPATSPWAITLGTNPVGPGSIPWYTVRSTNSSGSAIGNIQPSTGVHVEQSIGTPNANPQGIVTGPDGNLWFTEAADKIGMLNPHNGLLFEFPVSPGSSPNGIVSGPGGLLWFTETGANKIGSISPSSPHTINTVTVPTAASQPTSIAVGSDGNLWFTESAANKIGKFNPTTNTFTEYTIPTDPAHLNPNPRGIIAGPDGNLWFVNTNTSQFALVSTSGVFGRFDIPTPNSSPKGMALGPDGNVWFTEGGAGKIGQIVGPSVILVSPSNRTLGLKQTQVSTFATFTDGAPFATAADFTATIDFGDGQSAPGAITKVGSTFFVKASHQYTHVGTVAPTVTVTLAGTTVTASATSTIQVVGVAGDYNGDGKADLGIFDKTTAFYGINLSGGGSIVQQIGNPADKLFPITGDFDHDGKADVGIYDKTTGFFGINLSGGGTLFQTIGNKADNLVPVVGDYNGDGISDLGILDKTTGFTGINLSGGGSIVQQVGNPADNLLPVAGDYDGDGKTDVGIYDKTTGFFGINLSGGGSIVQQVGNTADNLVPVVGDYDGDGKTDVGIFDKTTAFYGINLSGGGSLVQQIGNKADTLIPAVGNFDADGKADVGIYDKTTNTFGIVLSGGGTLFQSIGNPANNLVAVAGDDQSTIVFVALA